MQLFDPVQLRRRRSQRAASMLPPPIEDVRTDIPKKMHSDHMPSSLMYNTIQRLYLDTLEDETITEITSESQP